jgi:prepilin-type N-terminal cleavage/methylation domain-containing protein
MNNKSFTLIELLVVIVIIGILAGVIMISTSSSIDKANIAKLKVFEESVANNLAANMVSRWKLDEIVNTNQTPDQWGSNAGTLYGTNGLAQLRPSSECVTDGCFKFDGTDDYVSCTISDSLNITDKVTITGWVKTNTLKECGLFGNNYWSEYTYGFRMNLYGNIYFRIYNSTGESKEAGSFIPILNIWYFIVGTFDKNIASSNMKLYIDTKLIGTGYSENMHFSVGDFYIGSTNTADRFFSGFIDDAKVYNTVLSLSEIRRNYVAGLHSLLSKGSMSREDYNQRINELAYEK